METLSRPSVAERFTQAARKAVFFSRYEAAQFSSPSIEPHYVLLALLRAGKPLLAAWSLDSPEAAQSIGLEVGTAFRRKRI